MHNAVIRWMAVLACVACTPAPAPPSPCRAASMAKDHAAARAVCAAALSSDPAALMALARAHFHFGDYPAVIALANTSEGHRDHGALLRLVASAHQRNKNSADAIAALQRAVELHTGNQQPAQVARDAQALAGIQHGAGEYRAALLWMARAQAAAIAAGDRRMLGFVQLARASIADEVGDGHGTEHALRLAEALLDRPADRAWAALKLGILNRERGRPESARVDFDRATELAGDDAHRFVRRALDLNRALIDRDQGRLDEAAQTLAALRVTLNERPDPRFEIALSYNEAVVWRRLGRLADAQRLLDSVVAQTQMPEFHWRAQRELGLLAETRGDRGAAIRAFEASIRHIEAMRARLEINELKSWFLDAKRTPYAALFALHANAGEHAQAYAVQERANARMFLDAFIARADTLPASDRTNLRDVLRAVASGTRPSAEAVLAAVRGRTVFAWFEAGGRWWRTSVINGVPHVERLAISPAALKTQVNRWRANLDDPVQAAALARVLLPRDLPSGRLHLVPTGPLTRIPFAALRHGVGPLIAHHEVVVVPSVASLVAPVQVGRGARVLADPTRDLPHAAAEGQAVATALKTQSTTGLAATSTALFESRDARILHLATHAGLGAEGAWLQLADRRVHAPEIVAQAVGPTTVVLASCASGASPNRALWGSLGAAFLAAGSTTAVVTLQSVDDAAARAMIERFYGAGGATDPVAALAIAQRAAAQTMKVSEWGLFVAIGAR